MTLEKFRRLVITACLILFAGYVGFRFGQKKIITVSQDASVPSPIVTVSRTSPPANREVDFSIFWDVWDRLEQRYLDKKALDPQKMVYGAVSGMVASLADPYTVFLPPKDNAGFKDDLNGSFEGIGAQLGSKDDKIIVIAPLKGQPAEKMGIRPGDWIIKVNGEDTAGWTVPQAVTKIRGPNLTKVTLTIMHENSQTAVEIEVTREKITIKSVEYEVKQSTSETCKLRNCPNVGYIKLSRFGDATNTEWNQSINEVKSNIRSSPKISGIILDLRNNSGGYFQSAIYVASEFIRSGVVVLQENSDGTKETFNVNRQGNLLDIPLVVLINKGSASASEIVAGALKDHKRAVLIGETSFGKGTVQSPEDLPDKSGIHITTARWILPSGEWIHGKGIKPDTEVKTSTGSADLQLEKAIEELTK